MDHATGLSQRPCAVAEADANIEHHRPTSDPPTDIKPAPNVWAGKAAKPIWIFASMSTIPELGNRLRAADLSCQCVFVHLQTPHRELPSARLRYGRLQTFELLACGS